MVFQNPDSTLNPTQAVRQILARPLRINRSVPRSELKAEVSRLLAAVNLDDSYLHRKPRQMSGGEKQRVAIARAFASKPELVVCDEPVSALDVSVQCAVLNTLLGIQDEFGTSLLFISHDLHMVRYLCDTLMVMYLGKMAETGPTEALFEPPYHPYTEALLSAVPVPDPSVEQARIRLEGAVPSALNPPTGCRFHTRCPRKVGEICEMEDPPGREASKNHMIYCHIPLEELAKMEAVL
jgi:peptide/nickel transport system ATP-binding protein